MASLSDQIDRLTRNARSVQATAAAVIDRANAPTIFTDAVLTTPVADLIRDADPAELGLFTLIQPTQDAPQVPEVKRVEFVGATPLRKNRATAEIEPETYANAALKYINQYQPIRPMPRAYDRIVSVLERLADVRKNIAELNDSLKKVEELDDEPLPKQRVEQETRRVQDLQVRLQELAKKKEELIKKQRVATARKKPASPVPQKNPLPVVASPESPQDKFWNTPMGPSRTLKFTDNLMDEHVDVNDISMTFSSPGGPSPLQRDLSTMEDDTIMMAPVRPVEERAPKREASPSPPPESKKAPALPEAPTPVIEARPQSSISEAQASIKSVDTPRRKPKASLELDRIVTKIWSSVGEVILPHSSTKTMPINETIAHIDFLSSQTPATESPVASSVSSISADGSNPSFHQVMTACLLHQLLTPPHSIALNRLKDNMTMKARSCGIAAAQGRVTRIVYECVAKRLIKIDRSSGEQTVRFDV